MARSTKNETIYGSIRRILIEENICADKSTRSTKNVEALKEEEKIGDMKSPVRKRSLRRFSK